MDLLYDGNRSKTKEQLIYKVIPEREIRRNKLPFS